MYLGLLWLEFAKEASCQENMTQGDSDNGPYYNEAVSFAPHGEEAYAKLCFEVKRPDGPETETYEIAISDDRTIVTEFVNDQKQRTINFLPPVADATRRREHSKWAMVSCYC